MAGPSHSLPEGNVTFLLTDIEGSTPLLKRLRDGYERILDEHHRIIRATVARHDVIEFRTMGDGFIFVSSDPAAAGPGLCHRASDGTPELGASQVADTMVS